MIVTFTANPSLDRTVALPGPLPRGAVPRAVSVSQATGGPGAHGSRPPVPPRMPTHPLLPCPVTAPIPTRRPHHVSPLSPPPRPL